MKTYHFRTKEHRGWKEIPYHNVDSLIDLTTDCLVDFIYTPERKIFVGFERWEDLPKGRILNWSYPKHYSENGRKIFYTDNAQKIIEPEGERTGKIISEFDLDKRTLNKISSQPNGIKVEIYREFKGSTEQLMGILSTRRDPLRKSIIPLIRRGLDRLVKKSPEEK